VAREAIGHALELDPGYAPAYTTLANLAMNYEQDLLAADTHLSSINFNMTLLDY